MARTNPFELGKEERSGSLVSVEFNGTFLLITHFYDLLIIPQISTVALIAAIVF